MIDINKHHLWPSPDRETLETLLCQTLKTALLLNMDIYGVDLSSGRGRKRKKSWETALMSKQQGLVSNTTGDVRVQTWPWWWHKDWPGPRTWGAETAASSIIHLSHSHLGWRALKQRPTKHRLHCNSCSLQTVGELGLACPRAACKPWATGNAWLAQYLLAFNQPAGLAPLFASTQHNCKSKVPLWSLNLADLLLADTNCTD